MARDAAVQRVNDLVAQRFPDSDAGVTLASDGRGTVQVAGNGQQAVRDALNQAGLGEVASVETVAHSLNQLKALTQRIAADSPNQWLGTPDVVQWGPDVASNKVVFCLHHDDPAVAQRLLAQYGADWVTVSARPMPWPQRRADRYSDTPPFYGGDGIQIHGDTPSVECTSGFDVIGRVHHQTYMLTAGHCANVGTYIDTNISSPVTMGRVADQAFSPFGLDADLIVASTRLTSGAAGRTSRP